MDREIETPCLKEELQTLDDSSPVGWRSLDRICLSRWIRWTYG